jgi:penicillin-binding protein 1C
VKPLALLVALLLAGCGAPPAFDDVRAAHRPSDAWLLDRHGTPIDVERIDFGVRRLPWTALADMSTALVAATVAAEDRRFFDHAGVDVHALAGAAWGYVRGERGRGASTLTMQLAAKLDPALRASAGRRTVGQKLRQIVAALALERAWRKEEILEAYFNLVDFEGELAGIGATARYLLGKAPAGIDEPEAAVLAARLRAPNADPATIARRACAVARQARFSIGCDVIAASARSGARRPSIEPSLAPEVARRLLRHAGERVVSTLDADLQADVREALTDQLRSLVRRNVRDGAAVVLDNASGDVLAWVGSAGPESRARDVDGVRALRQAGSTLKPFLYALLLERRHLTAASLLDDSPVELETTSGLYIPQNYDRTFRGLVSVRSALAESMNVPAVRALTLVGVEPFREALRALGYESVREAGEFYGYSLALGSAEVSLIEQANAYRALANGGRYSDVRLHPGAPIRTRAVLDPGAAFIVADILSDRGSRARAFGLDNPLTTRFWSAVKTGTSKDMRDNWCIGFSARYTVAVWVGNFEGDSMHDVSGVTGAAPAWLSIMRRLHRDDVDSPRVPPANVVAHEVRFDDDLEPPRREWFIAGTELPRVARASRARSARILSPPNGVVIALDPDIPQRHQSVLIETTGADVGSQVELDGTRLATLGGRSVWTPTPGRHVVRVVAAGATLDRIAFTVRAPGSAGSSR